MGAKVGGKKGGAMADINVTPLVDVVLVLLIIFMVVTPMLSSGVDVKLAKAKTADSEKDMGQHLVVTVKSDGDAYVDRTPVTLDTIADEVIRVRANRGIVVKGDRSATYKMVRDVTDAIHQKVPATDTILLACDRPKEAE